MKNKGHNTKNAIVDLTTPIKNLLLRQNENHSLPPPIFAPDHTNQTKHQYPILSSFGIPTDFESEESEIKIRQVIAELVKLHKQNEKPLTFEYVGNGYPGRLVAIPRALNRDTYHKMQKKCGWLEEIILHIASGKKKR